jgi:cell wall assembly regulator SMI1
MVVDSDLLVTAFYEFRSTLACRFPSVLPEIRKPVLFAVPYTSLPGSEQLSALWKLTSGQANGKDGTLGLAGGLRLLGPKESESERTDWLRLMNKGTGMDAVANPNWDNSTSKDPLAVRAVYFAAGWIPVLAEPYEANYLAVDLVPLQKGRAGQVILCGRDEDEKHVVAPDLATLFLALSAECEKGAWVMKQKVTETGKTFRYFERRGGRLLSACKVGDWRS